MPRSLPPNPSIRFLQLEAKDIVKAHKSGDIGCCSTLRYHFRFSRAEDEEILKARVSLQEAQHALALDYGFTSWADLTAEAKELSKGGPPGDGTEPVDGDAAIAIEQSNSLLLESYRARASDIHIEPNRDGYRARNRVDGVLRDLAFPSKEEGMKIASRIKAMADLDTAERELPQAGRAQVMMDGEKVDIRVSTIPTALGERMVLRLLSKSQSPLKLSDLGLSEKGQKLVRQLMSEPNGMLLIAGPTGSGKTTTLYALLESISTPEINILTIENPIEYQIDGVSQMQTSRDLTFAAGLRHILRQDPDVICIGEIGDSETAQLAMQSALTGHLVLSTTHTNDAAGAITRLVDLGIEPYLVSSALIGVVSQRLVRVLCRDCREPFSPDRMTLENIGIAPDQLKKGTLFRASGCEKCAGGYVGRTGLFEVMVLDETTRSMIAQGHDAGQITSEAMAQGMTTLREDGIQKVIDGMTSIEEMLRALRM